MQKKQNNDEFTLLQEGDELPEDIQYVEEDVEPEPPQEVMVLPETPDLALQIEQENRKRELLTAYIKKNLKDGADFYTLTIGGRQSKPSLSKSGSEKFLSLFNLTAKFRKDDETWEMFGKPAGMLCYVCELYSKNGTLVGEGRGARDIAKDKDPNKVIKMAQKSAQVDAILRTGALSDVFTQDIEDMPQTAPQAPIESLDDAFAEVNQSNPPQTNYRASSAILECHGVGKNGCPDGATITQAEYDYSSKFFGKPLCRNCQKVGAKSK